MSNKPEPTINITGSEVELFDKIVLHFVNQASFLYLYEQDSNDEYVMCFAAQKAIENATLYAQAVILERRKYTKSTNPKKMIKLTNGDSREY